MNRLLILLIVTFTSRVIAGDGVVVGDNEYYKNPEDAEIIADHDGIQVTGESNVIENAGSILAGSNGIQVSGINNTIVNMVGGDITGNIGVSFSDVAAGTNRLLIRSGSSITGESGLAIDGGSSSTLGVVSEAGSTVNGDIQLQGDLDVSGTVNGAVTHDGSWGAAYGVGTITGGLTIEEGDLSPGTATGMAGLESWGAGILGTLTSGSLNLGPNSTLIIDLTETPGQHDRLIVAGDVNIDGANLNLLTEYDFHSIGNHPYTFEIIKVGGEVTGRFASPLFEPALLAKPYIFYDGGDGNDIVVRINLTAEHHLEWLITFVTDLNLDVGITKKLHKKLESALAALNDDNDLAALKSMNAFCKRVEAQRGKKITEREAHDLTWEASFVIIAIDEFAPICV